MRVLRLTPHYYVDNGEWPAHLDLVGGMQVQIRGMTSWLHRELGVGQTVATMTSFFSPRAKIVLGTPVVNTLPFVVPIRSRHSGTLLLNESWFLGTVCWLLRRRKWIADRFDLLHVHASGRAEPLLIALLCRRWFRLPVVLTIHCSTHSTYRHHSLADRLQHAIARVLEAKAVAASDHTIFLTEATAAAHRERLDPDRCSVIGDATYISTEPTELPESLAAALPPNRKICLFVGRISWEKGWDLFLEAARRLRARRPDELHFVVCGDGPEHERMASMARELELADDLSITGFISHRYVGAVMARSSVLVLPSRYEEFGGVILEAAVHRLAVVSSTTSGPSKILSHGHNGLLFATGEPDGLARQVERALDDEALRRRLTENLQREVDARFSPRAIGRQLHAVYESVCRNPRRGRGRSSAGDAARELDLEQ